MNVDFAKYADGLVPAIVQDDATGLVLMLGFMNGDAIEATRTSGRVTFYSRSKRRLWTKGETSGNYLAVVSIIADCDADTLLIKTNPAGPVCHTGWDTCFGERNGIGLIEELETVISNRILSPSEESYVSRLFERGINKIAQKVGEEAVELVIAAKEDSIDELKGEAADLLFHYLILLQARGLRLSDVLEVLASRRGN
jgi:phosphoribosyl-AMP cyclohydrolase / phosphoribosyl-ATP pyrophosphohydrolase